MLGIGMNRREFAVFLSVILLYDCIFVNFKYEAEYRILYSLFPPKFYHTVASQTEKPNNPCAWIHTCEASNHDTTFPSCFCDHACKGYDDCCFDATTNSNITSERVKLQYENKRLFTCETKAFQNEFHGILVISKCPENYNFSDVSEKCEKSDNVHPVSANDGTTFRNVYCAYCHNIRHYNAWRFEHYYSGNCHAAKMQLLNASLPNYIRYVTEKNCYYHFFPPSTAKIRSCLKNVENRVAADNLLCSQFQSPVVIDNQVFRNVYCYNASLSNKNQHCVPPHSLSNGTKGYGSLELTRIFNIRPLFEIFGRKTCEENFHYDNIKDTCVPNNCRAGEEDNCDAELIRNYQWVMSLKFITNGLIDRPFQIRLLSFIYLSLPRQSYQIRINSYRGRYKCRKNEPNNGKSCCVSDIYIMFSNGIEMTVDETKRFKSSVNQVEWSYTESKNKTNITTFDVSKKPNLTDGCNVTGIFQNVFDGFSGEISATELQFVIDKPLMPPTDIPKSVEGFLVISDSNASISELKLETWNFQFVARNENIQNNCTTMTSPELYVTSDWSVGTILTYTTLGISCFFLILTLSIYSYFGLFQSTYGVISKCMMITMLAAQLLFIVGVGASYVTPVCRAIGIISHYLWLTSFTWISIFLFSILKMMRTLYKCPGANTKGLKLSRTVYSFGFILPFFFVLPCLFLDIFSEIYIGYSDGNICFLTGFMANLFSFTLPILLSLCFNIVALIITSVSISRYNNTDILLQSVQQTRSFVPIYLRLSMLCACPWILGIISDILQLESLRYIYIILAGSHGTFVGVSFLFAKSVRDRLICSRPLKSTKEIQLDALK